MQICSKVIFVLLLGTMMFGCTPTPSPETTKVEPTVHPQPIKEPIKHQFPTEEVTIDIQVLVHVTGFASDEGNCRIAIYLGPKNFNNAEFAIVKQVVSIEQKKADWSTTIQLTPEQIESYRGQSLPVAVSAFHDSNKNEKLDKGAFGIPTERYGFSNNPKRGYGPPKFQETVILTDHKLEAEIQLQ